MLSLIPFPKNKRELLNNASHLVGHEFAIAAQAGNGNGAAGRMAELFCGSRGGNKPFADAFGVDIKFHDSSSPSDLTLFHKTCLGGVKTMSQLVGTLGIIDSNGRRSLRHFPKNSFRIIEEEGRLVVRFDQQPELQMSWRTDELLTLACNKLANVLLLTGHVHKQDGVRWVRFDALTHLSGFRSTRFLMAVLGGLVRIEPDARQRIAGSLTLRDHGTKFRISPDRLDYLWADRSVSPQAKAA